MHNRFLLETCGVLQEKIKNVCGIFETPTSMALVKGRFTYLDQLFTLWRVSVATPLWPSVGLQVWGWSPTLGKVGGLESAGTPECSELNSKSQNTSHWGVLGVVGKVLKLRYRKWPRIGHSDICSPNYGQKKGRESNWQFDSRPLKVGNRPLPDVALKCATQRWKDFDESYNFGLGLVPIHVRGEELWSSKVSGLQLGTVSGLHFGNPNKMCHSDVASATNRKEYYKGEGGGFPRVRAVVSFVCPSACGKSQHQRVSRMLN
jgi:hypothetical protein